jgi:hypothetical protein
MYREVMRRIANVHRFRLGQQEALEPSRPKNTHVGQSAARLIAIGRLARGAEIPSSMLAAAERLRAG